METYRIKNGNGAALPEITNRQGDRRCPPSSIRTSHVESLPASLLSTKIHKCQPLKQMEDGSGSLFSPLPHTEVPMNQPGLPYTKIPDILNDALDGAWFFVRGVEVDYRYVMTSTVKELLDLLSVGALCRSEVVNG